MDWKQILSLSNENLTDERKEEIYNELIKDQKFDSKIAKKLFPLCLNILKHKGQQVEKQRDEIEMLASSDIDLKSTLEQMEKQKRMLAKYEAERSQFKARIKELSEEIALMHGRELQGSDEDSPDQLSEIDKQQELMAKISAKNKHIKRLLRDIEKQEHEAASYLNVIKNMKTSVEQANEKIAQLETQLTDSAATNEYLEKRVSELSNQLLEQERENQQLVSLGREKDKERQMFSTQVEERCMVYKAILDEKQREIDALKERYETLIEQVPGMDVDSVEVENKRLMDSSKQKDELIKLYDEKFQLLSAEFMDSTETIKNLITERDELREKLSRNRSDACCKETRAILERSNERTMELQEMLDKADSDNILKSQQAFEAIETLKSYENSTDGLAHALKKIHQLQETVHRRDKEIQEYVVEINAQNEVVAENAVLRRRLGMSDDETVDTKTFRAQQKRYGKINDRLLLKLRASEEMRLQLKIDKHDLKRKIAQLEDRLRGGNEDDDLNQSRTPSECNEVPKTKTRESHRVEMRQCRNCATAYNVYESLKYCRDCMRGQNLCENCTTNFKETSTENVGLIKKIAKLEVDHQSIVEENENLRHGLNEILVELRDYEGTDRAIVSPATLEKLIHILNLRSNMGADPLEQQTTEMSTAPALNNPIQDNDDARDETLQLKLLIKSLTEENEEMKLSLEKMNKLQELYEELVRSSELSDDDKHRLLVRSLEKCHEFETNLKAYERKIDFLMDENDNLHREMRLLKVSSVELVNDMKMEILSKSEEMMAAIDMHERDEDTDISSVEEELQRLRLELNGLCFNVLKNLKALDHENLLDGVDKEQLSNVTVIESNLSTTFITRSELDSLNAKLAKMQETISAHEMRAVHLEELAKIAQHQLKTQQQMLSKFSEDEVVTRHLIVDLQSQSNDNYLLTKTTRELVASKESVDQARLENDKLKSEIIMLEEKLLQARQVLDENKRDSTKRESRNLLKIQYLKKSLVDLCNNYSTMTPIYLIADFIKHYAALLDAKKQFELSKTSAPSMPEVSHDSLVAQLREMSLTDIEAKIEAAKQKSSCDYLQQQLAVHESTISELHNEIARIKLNEIKSAQHWNAIRMLFEGVRDNRSEDDVDTMVAAAAAATTAVVDEKVKCDKEIQVDAVMRRDCGTNTDVEQPQPQQVSQISSQTAPAMEPLQPSRELPSQPQPNDEEGDSLEMQLKMALSLASSRSSLLIETENLLSEAQGRIKSLEKLLESHKLREAEQNKPQQQQQHSEQGVGIGRDDHIMNITIATLQNLIVDKDANISRYQEILKSERKQSMRTFDENSEHIKQLKKVIDFHETTIDERNKLIEKLKATVSELSEKLLTSVIKPASPVAQQHRPVAFSDSDGMEMKLKEAHTEIKRMEQQINDLTNTERLLQNVIHEKEVAIKELNIKLKASNDNLDALSVNFSTASPEIDSLRDMLEEKDKHIQDLTETLNQFHDDQQKYITDTAFSSAEQATAMSVNLARSESKIRVLETHLDSIKRQMTNVHQREKNSRDLIKTLKDQLIRRPVISVKSDKRATTPREEQQQKRISELESELLDARDELRRQININDNKKAKNAAELGLWDKQKRYQEMSERLKAKLTEKEIDLDRTKASLQLARNASKRLENEKIMLENKLKSGQYLQKYQATAPPPPCQGCTMRINSHGSLSVMSDTTDYSRDASMISSLRARNESLQRQVIAMSFEQKGKSVLVREYEKIQEKLSSTEAKVMRLESANAQLQIEIDLAIQSNQGKSQEEKLKYLEDYIFVLKEELTQARLAATPAPKFKGSEESASNKIHDMEQAILNLKLIVEKLHAENKYLRNAKSRPSASSSSATPTFAYMSASDRKKEETFEKLRNEYEKLQKSYNELLSKNSKMQIELELLQVQTQTISASCPHCDKKNMDELATQDVDSLKVKLQHRDEMIERAKALLRRSKARELQLKEMVIALKKKICELEGVPVISEENSESGVS